MSEWLAEHLKAVAFLQSVDAAAVWKQLVGREPDRTARDGRTATTTLAGAHDGLWLILQGSPFRIDLTLRALPAEVTEKEQELHIGRLDDRLGVLRERTKAFLAQLSGPSRVAFGAVLLIPTTDRAAGYMTLQRYLSAVKLDSASSDFGYQINRPRDLGGLKVNRLSVWSVQLHVPFKVNITGQGQGAIFQPGPPSAACRLQLDMSTDESRVEPLADPSGAFDILISQGAEIAEKGDVK